MTHRDLYIWSKIIGQSWSRLVIGWLRAACEPGSVFFVFFCSQKMRFMGTLHPWPFDALSLTCYPPPYVRQSIPQLLPRTGNWKCTSWLLGMFIFLFTVLHYLLVNMKENFMLCHRWLRKEHHWLRFVIVQFTYLSCHIQSRTLHTLHLVSTSKAIEWQKFWKGGL